MKTGKERFDLYQVVSELEAIERDKQDGQEPPQASMCIEIIDGSTTHAVSDYGRDRLCRG